MTDTNQVVSHAFQHAVQEGAPVTVSWTVMFLGTTEGIQSFTKQLPDWTATTAMTTFQSSWTWTGYV